MSGYVCPECNRKAKLPDFCCGRSMLASGTYYCPECKSKSVHDGTCSCGTAMTQV